MARDLLISFDLDYTLMKNPFRQYVFPELQQLLGAHPPFQEKCIRARLKEEHAERLSEGRLASAYHWDEMLEKVTGKLGIPCPVSIQELVQKHAAIGKVWLFSDVLPALEKLKGMNIPMVVASNGFERYQRPVTDCLGITSYFQGYYTPERLSFAKPQPEFFHFRGDRKLIHVGDRLDHDILGANSADAVSVWIYRELPFSWRQIPVWQRKDHPQLVQLLQKKLHQEGSPLQLLDQVIPRYILSSLDEIVWVLQIERGER
ncbi:HAD family hydrolase [Lihuaxuella thermophila]|uniref:FMN phosphatase YigB, HAD superfamily n=1 Tax=Lihuaxuella thermophila TaxID=1173111 RepID=A0A1H8AP59_9BACL|nr:HAD family hydrolase [Lihuaxuella thermophila]SEM71307.1 FMN phosphatase YigB, HAD superfamily [Lihuaxuella thermophila]